MNNEQVVIQIIDLVVMGLIPNKSVRDDTYPKVNPTLRSNAQYGPEN